MLFKPIASLIAKAGGASRWQKRVHLGFYNFLASRFDENVPWQFMNYGIAAGDPGAARLAVRPEDERDRCHIELYHELLSTLPVRGARVLDVGSGRGGGSHYIATYHLPSRVIGLDLSHRAAVLAASRAVPCRAAFLCADAERLPLQDDSVDIVVNVESSHAYPSMPAFLSEACRVLRPGGWLAWADLRWTTGDGADSGLTTLRRHLACSGLVTRRETDLSARVLTALETTAAYRREWADAHVPWLLRGLFHQLSGQPGTYIHERLRSRQLVYWSALLQKPPVTDPVARAAPQVVLSNAGR